MLHKLTKVNKRKSTITFFCSPIAHNVGVDGELPDEADDATDEEKNLSKHN